MFWTRKSHQRRAEIRKNRPDTRAHTWQYLKDTGGLNGIAIALGFCIVASIILQLREEVVPYRPGQWVPHDIVARVDFSYRDKEKLSTERQRARDNQPRIYAAASTDVWAKLEKDLLALPEEVGNSNSVEELKPPLRDVVSPGTLTKL